METKFNLYDVFAILFPGSIALLSIAIFLPCGILNNQTIEWYAAILFLPPAYALGMVFHQISRHMLSVKGLPERLMSPDDDTFTLSFKQAVLATAGRVFGNAVKDSVKQGKRFGDVNTTTFFELCYDLVIQRGHGVYTENLNAMYGLCRNMLGVTLLTTLLAVMHVFSRVDYWLHVFIWVVGILVFAAVVMLAFHKGMQEFARRFTISVYRSFFLMFVGDRLVATKVRRRRSEENA